MTHAALVPHVFMPHFAYQVLPSYICIQLSVLYCMVESLDPYVTATHTLIFVFGGTNMYIINMSGADLIVDTQEHLGL